MLWLGLFFALYYFVQILRFLTFNFFSVRSIFFRANRWSVLSSADLTMNCELELEFESSHIVACVLAVGRLGLAADVYPEFSGLEARAPRHRPD